MMGLYIYQLQVFLSPLPPLKNPNSTTNLGAKLVHLLLILSISPKQNG
jgi:hypothetical protein